MEDWNEDYFNKEIIIMNVQKIIRKSLSLSLILIVTFYTNAIAQVPSYKNFKSSYIPHNKIIKSHNPDEYIMFGLLDKMDLENLIPFCSKYIKDDDKRIFLTIIKGVSREKASRIINNMEAEYQVKGINWLDNYWALDFIFYLSEENYNTISSKLIALKNYDSKQNDIDTFYDAIKRNDIQHVKLLIAKGFDVNVKFKDGSNSLINAANNNREEIVKILLENGANVNAEIGGGYTALILASFQGFEEIVETLLKFKADVKIACSKGTALILAAESANVEVLRKLIKYGADVNTKNREKGKTALMRAAWAGNIECVKLLVENRANINAKNNKGYTAIMSASLHGRLEVINYLIENGADTNIKANNGMTALMFAAMNGELEAVKILLKAGADINAKDENGVTTLRYASMSTRKDVADFLLNYEE